jgi:putative FmdB family regulatory protein
MPTYDFQCPTCGYQLEAMQPYDAPSPDCPNCHERAVRLLGAPAVHGSMSRGRELAVRSIKTKTGPCPACAAGRAHVHGPK